MRTRYAPEGMLAELEAVSAPDPPAGFLHLRINSSVRDAIARRIGKDRADPQDCRRHVENAVNAFLLALELEAVS